MKPTVRLNRVARNPYHAKIDDEKLHMKPTVRLNGTAVNPYHTKMRGNKKKKLELKKFKKANELAKNPFLRKN